MMGKMMLHLVRIILLLFPLLISVQANFDFTVRFYEYWNPTGLCAECGTNGVPVCCDDPLRTESCQNTGVFRCDTIIRFMLRPFNESLETAPNTGFRFFTPSRTNENHETFFIGPGGFLGAPNPSTLVNTSPWTGRIQLLVDAVDRINNNQAPNETEGVIERFLIDLDQLQLGAGLTNETTYTGIHNISQLSMSFQVNCSENYYGSDCTTFCEPVEGVYNCDNDGSIVCAEGRNSSIGCTECLTGRNLATNCTSCVSGYIGESCLKNPCVSDLCENGATCTPDDTTGEYECQCAAGFGGMNCDQPTESQSVDVALIGGVVGGVGGALVLIVVILVLVIVCLTLQLRTKHRGELDVSENDYTREHVMMNSFNTNTGGSAEHQFDNTLYGSGNTEKQAMEMEYSQPHHNIKAEPTHPTKHTVPAVSTTDGTTSNNSTIGHEPAQQLTYDSANHHTGYTSPPVQPISGLPPSNYDIAYPVPGPESQFHPQPPVYDTANHPPPPSSIYSDVTDDRAQKKPPPPFYETTDDPTGKSRPSIYDDTISPPVSATNEYHYIAPDSIKDEKNPPKSLPVYYESADLPPSSDTYDDVLSKQPRPEPPVYDTADNPPANHRGTTLPVYESADSPPRVTQNVVSIYDDTTTSSTQQQSGHMYDYATTDTQQQPASGKRPVYDYVDNPINVSLPKEELTYDYADSPVQVRLPPEFSDTVPATHEYSHLDRTTYTNTAPGKITKESEAHYDFGQ